MTPMRRAVLTASFALAVACSGTNGAEDDGKVFRADTAPDSQDSSAPTDTAADTGLDEGVTDTADVGKPLGPPYPIVLAHGFFGFEDFAGTGFITYFYNVKDDLAKRGEVQVFTPAVDPFNDSTTRGLELLARVKEILVKTGAAKVNLIGHSQGGLDARVVAHERPDLVASVVTIGTPHGGAPIADIAAKLVTDDRFKDVVDSLAKLVGGALWSAAGEKTSLIRGFLQFTKPAVADFAAAYPDMPGVSYYSIAGRTALHDGGSACVTADAPAFVTKWKTTLDTTDPLLKIPESVTAGGLANDPNDGLVRVVDAKHGTFLGCIPADHLDEMGQLLGDAPGVGNKWDHLQFYADVVGYLRAKGL